jgi:hypothetical protein
MEFEGGERRRKKMRITRKLATRNKTMNGEKNGGAKL